MSRRLSCFFCSLSTNEFMKSITLTCVSAVLFFFVDMPHLNYIFAAFGSSGPQIFCCILSYRLNIITFVLVPGLVEEAISHNPSLLSLEILSYKTCDQVSFYG